MARHTPATLLGAVLNRLRGWTGLLWRWEANFKGVEFEGRCEFLGRPLLHVAPEARLIMGDGTRICSSRRSNPLGLAQPTVLAAIAPGARLVLGPRVGLSGNTVCAAAVIEIGEGTILGAGAMVVDHDLHLASAPWGWTKNGEAQTTAKPVKIGRGVFIGARAIVRKGVAIGDRAVVGAGAVVTTDVPAHHIAAGNPARIFKPKGDQSKA